MTGPEKSAERLRWFLSVLETPPARIHVRGVWSDRETGLGSKLGSPALHRGFSDLIELPAHAGRTESFERPCFHPLVTEADRAAGALCPDCGVRDEAGRIITETGTVKGERTLYRWPVRAAIAKVARIPVPVGRPPLDVTLRSIARAGGDLDAAAEALLVRWPAMGDPRTARAHFDTALIRVRRVFRDDPPARLLPRTVGEKSDAQLNAEAS